MNKKAISLSCALILGSTMAFSAQYETNKAVEKKNEFSQKAGAFSEEHSAHKKTADSQMMESDSDVAVTRKIRNRLTDMDNLSTRAQNVTIVTESETITLKGEVDKQEEIQKIMNVAQEVSSGRNISNQLRVHK